MCSGTTSLFSTPTEGKYKPQQNSNTKKPKKLNCKDGVLPATYERQQNATIASKKVAISLDITFTLSPIIVVMEAPIIHDIMNSAKIRP
jgi:hypothetical protein